MVAEIGPTVIILIYLAFAMGLANVCLLLGLLNSYWKTYKEIKSQFTIGLLYFGSFLLIQNILVTIALVVPLIVHLVPFEISNSEFGPRILFILINMIQLVALSILYKITRN
ncbi:hypothetical protein [Methanobacterium spitsbergense]|uniref:Uncharacterized protein n=1 Tax=Methanobacterium spitsbergense TaxID=2874285 RepID=A0A8T5V249_9EURY|nr:hypothetical protein [Methanobacterium spitsbergense]MBZ2165931.1 hypothetical protein [Methanobacterium spitsbergense]